MPPSSVADQHPEREGPPVLTWEFVPVSDYAPPPPGVVETTKRSINILWRRLHPEKKEPVPYVKPEDQLTRLPPWQLQRAAPRPDWTEAAEALDAALGDWVTDAPSDQPVRPVVTPPHANRGAVLAGWADERGWRIVPPPSPQQILSGSNDWLAEHFSPDEDTAPWVLPNLERLYLRHTAGLDLVSAFLDRAHTGTLGPGLVGCDSWAWAFLDHVWRGWLPPSLTLQAYDEDRLAVVFQQFARTAGGRQLRFRQSADGSDVLPPPDSRPPRTIRATSSTTWPPTAAATLASPGPRGDRR